MDDDLQQLERELGLFLRRATASSAAMARMVHPELEPAAYELLALIGRTPDVRASDIAAYIGVGRGTMSRQLARLSALGLIVRVTDPDDFRGQLLSLTPLGQERLAGAQRARQTFLGNALDGWAPDQITLLTAQLGRLNRDLTSAWTTQTPARERTGV
ncbi:MULTISPECIES: MarR family winged helix-turn-helix transcriptional regulator [Cellulomonas]|uniref:Regulatory protein MarR n=1 Tax=Cellulomonas gilvus (strain ATCC 13127 / NRRL B-14078) TaxID=593907 RepID=F8A3V5_CELGA|nr:MULTISPECIES: MarR family transcriptional regulator [Cellulomonas]AEI13147.1 regulatory protein MarR [Cellulomonas gilvus ATCC 13127]MCR6689098.1 MarR family transcriptional regulator [Cellulomonas sp.]